MWPWTGKDLSCRLVLAILAVTGVESALGSALEPALGLHMALAQASGPIPWSHLMTGIVAEQAAAKTDFS